MSTPNPYRWDGDHPGRSIDRAPLREAVLSSVLRGKAVRLVGGRGMGKSVLLRQVRDALAGVAATRVVLVPAATEASTVEGCVESLYHLLWGERPERPRFDELVERVSNEGAAQLVLLFDEVEGYVAGVPGGARDSLGRQWFNFLEARRKALSSALGVVVAGGVGLLYLERELGSGLMSRADSVLLKPFTLDEVRELAGPFSEDGRALTEPTLALILALTGGNPALVTYAFERLWLEPAPGEGHVAAIFGAFRSEQGAFVRSVWSSVSQPGVMEAPRRVLEAVRRHGGNVPRDELLAACAAAGDRVVVELQQALQILRAAGLIRIEGSDAAEPLNACAVASILNLPERPSSEADPVERMVMDVASVLGQLHRFSRDFHGKKGLLEEQVFSSMLAVGLTLLGWSELAREPVQAAGYPDLRVRIGRPGLAGHVILEAKIWPRNDYQQLQAQLDAYRTSETLHCIAVMLGERGLDGWVTEYETGCLPPGQFERLPTPPDLVGHWRVVAGDPHGVVRRTDHLLVQLPKRS